MNHYLVKVTDEREYVQVDAHNEGEATRLAAQHRCAVVEDVFFLCPKAEDWEEVPF